MNKNGLVFTLRDEIDNAKNLKGNIELDLQLAVDGVLIKPKGKINADVNLSDEKGKVKLNNMDIDFNYKDKVKSKGLFNSTFSSYQALHFLNAFTSSSKDHFVDLEGLEEIESTQNSSLSQSYKLGKKQSAAIKGYKNSVILINKIANNRYNIKATIEVVDSKLKTNLVNNIRCDLEIL